MGGEESIKVSSNNLENYNPEKNILISEDKNEEKNKPEGKVIIYGFLQKRSKYVHLWKTRFCILTNHYLFAFTGVENDADCTMTLLLKNAISITPIKGYGKQNIFCIGCGSGNFFFRAETKPIMNKWITEIQKIINENIKTETIGKLTTKTTTYNSN